MMRSTVYPDVEAAIQALDPSYPVMCLFPKRIKAQARAFLEGFGARLGGRVLYAVKCNPHVRVLQALYQAGIHDFDTASLPEIAEVSELFPEAECFFNHPVKNRAAIEAASRIYEVRRWVIDHENELRKLIGIVGPGQLIQVRLATPQADASFDLSRKFGADVTEAARLLNLVLQADCRPALSFHVGSQCLAPDAYRIALALASEAVDKSGVDIEMINVGGGFPAADGVIRVPPLSAYFDAIAEGLARMALPRGTEILCEPGRALVARGASLIVQVQLRKEGRLYINDGVYGGLSDLKWGNLVPPVRAIRRNGGLSDELAAFTLYGPTCDSIDAMPPSFQLPQNIREGDWIEIGAVGAYSNAIASRFNGFSLDAYLEISDE